MVIRGINLNLWMAETEDRNKKSLGIGKRRDTRSSATRSDIEIYQPSVDKISAFGAELIEILNRNK